MAKLQQFTANFVNKVMILILTLALCWTTLDVKIKYALTYIFIYVFKNSLNSRKIKFDQWNLTSYSPIDA